MSAPRICPVMSRAVLYENRPDDLIAVPCQGHRCAWWVGRASTGVGRCAQAPNATSFPDPALFEASE